MSTVTYEELNEYYETKGTEGPCEVCQAQEWSHVGIDVGPAPLKLSVYERFPGFSVVFGLTCEACGNMRFTNGRAVLHWLYEKNNK